MRAYILCIAGAVLLSAVFSVIAPSGKMGNFIKGMSKLILLVVLLMPFFSLARGDGFVFESASLGEDEAYLSRCTSIAEEADAREICALLGEKYAISASVRIEYDENFLRRKIFVNIEDSGIFGQDRHIDMISDVTELLEERYGCCAEVS